MMGYMVRVNMKKGKILEEREEEGEYINEG